MIFGTHYGHVEDITSIVEHELGVQLVRFDHPELGVSYAFVQKVDGDEEDVVEIASTQVYDEDEDRYVLSDPDYENYSYIIYVNDGFPEMVEIFIKLIESGKIHATQIISTTNPEWL